MDVHALLVVLLVIDGTNIGIGYVPSDNGAKI